MSFPCAVIHNTVQEPQALSGEQKQETLCGDIRALLGHHSCPVIIRDRIKVAFPSICKAAGQ